MIFTPQCLVSRYNLAKIEQINITKKPVIMPAFWNKIYNLVKNTKYSSRKQNRNRLRVDVLLTLCSPGRNRGNMETRRRSRLRPRLHGSGRILLQVAVLFARVHGNFCTVSALEWLFWIFSALQWTNHVTLSPDCDISELTQQDGRGKTTANYVWQGWQ